MKRSCAIWILSCSLLLGQPGHCADDAVSIDYQSEQRSFSAVLDHLQVLADLQTTIDTALLEDDIHQASLHLILYQADRRTALQAICHASSAKMWWRQDADQNIFLSSSTTAPLNSTLRTQIYHSSTDQVQTFDALLRQGLQPWLQIRQSGMALIAEQRQWSLTLTDDGHTRCRRLLQMLERQYSDIPILPQLTLKRVLPLTEDIQSVSWSEAALALHRQMKCSISISAALSERKGPVRLRACPAEELPRQLQELQLHATWIDGVLCIGEQPAQVWQHPAMCHSIVIPLQQYRPADQRLLVEDCRALVSPAYWQQPGCLLEHIPFANSAVVIAHQHVLALILQEIARRDKLPAGP